MKADIGSLMKQAQKMQTQMQKAQEELAGLEVTGEAGGGLVQLRMTCKHEVRKLTIDSSLVGDDREMLEDVLIDFPGLTVVGERFFQFEPQGVTGTVLLAESHIAIHTWPEAGFVTVDVYVCNYTTDNTAKAEQVFRAIEKALRPARTRFQAIRRGGRDA